MSYSFDIPIQPCAKGRPRFDRRGFAYTPDKTRDAEKLLKQHLRLKWRMKPLTGPVVLSATFLYKKPKRTKLRFPKDDIDNTLKWLMDSCNEIIWHDDSQIYALGEVGKFWATESRVIFTVEERL